MATDQKVSGLNPDGVTKTTVTAVMVVFLCPYCNIIPPFVTLVFTESFGPDHPVFEDDTGNKSVFFSCLCMTQRCQI